MNINHNQPAITIDDSVSIYINISPQRIDLEFDSDLTTFSVTMSELDAIKLGEALIARANTAKKVGYGN